MSGCASLVRREGDELIRGLVLFRCKETEPLKLLIAADNSEILMRSNADRLRRFI